MKLRLQKKPETEGRSAGIPVTPQQRVRGGESKETNPKKVAVYNEQAR